MARLRISRLASLGALLFAFLMAPAFGQERFTRQVSFDIAAQSMEAALLEFSKQADVQVMVGTASLNGQKTEGVKGTLSVKDALQQLLKNTGLEYQTEGNSTITIRSAVAAKTDARVLPLVDGRTLASNGAAGEAAARDQVGIDEATAPTPDTLDEIIVTGTHIRGEISAGSHIQVINREDLEASGYATLQDVLTKALPQNYGGGPSEDFNTGAEGNFNSGTAVNLRGLGSDATLVLVNGRRQAMSGTEGAFVDVSSVPASAIERVEILSDGASAVYGSDAVGGVINIVLRNDFQGAESRARWGTAEGGIAERLLSQVVGTTWTTGNVIAGAQFNDREAMRRSARRRTASEDKRPFGGDDFRVSTSNPGNILDPNTFTPAYGIPPNQDGSALTPSALLPGVVNLQDFYKGGELLPDQEMRSAFFEARQRVTDRLSISAHARYSHREIEQKQFGITSPLFVPDTNPYFVDPFGGLPFVFVAYSFVDDLGPLVGAGETETLTTGVGGTLGIGRDWRLDLHADYGKETMEWLGKNQVNFAALDMALADPDPATAFNPFGDGSHTNPATLDAIRSTQRERGETDVESLNLVASGSIFELPAGTAKLALGMDYRDEGLEKGITSRRMLGRNVFAAFAEFALPILQTGEPNSGWRQRLELSAAARFEDYSDFGTTSNPKLGISWSPHGLFTVRGTWGTSFKAPKLVNLDESPGTGISGLIPFADPQSATGQSLVLAVFGNNSKLKEETATTWTAGLDFKLWNNEQALSLTYYSINFKDRIAQGGPSGDPTSILLQEQQWTDIINRSPAQADVDAICSSPDFFGNPADCTTTPPDLIIDFRQRNLSSVQVRGIDVQFGHELPTTSGVWGFTLNASRILSFERAVSPRAGTFDILDTVGNPQSFRLRGGLSWIHQGLSTNVFINYADDYVDDISQPHRKIDSWTTVDLRLGYSVGGSASWLGGIELALSVSNATNEEPPFLNAVHGYDLANADLLGRFISAQVTKTW